MKKIESSKHLFQPPIYLSENNSYNFFNDALNESSDVLSIDRAAVASYFSFGYVSGDRTIFNEIKRAPWMSSVDNNKVVLENVPKHDFYASEFKSLAEKFYNLLLDEARIAVKGFDNVYVLLSGGLDSRIVAGTIHSLYKNGEILNCPIGVTWGLENSRDVYYAKKMAEILDFDWVHAPLNPDVILKNIELTGKKLGLIHSPELLHNMNWFNENTKENSLVLAGSYGDSIGRGEFSGKQLLQLTIPKPKDDLNLLTKELKQNNYGLVNNDILNLFKRSETNINYANIECFQQGFRMRNGLSNAITIINDKAQVYQMFTAPEVYEFIWSLHPAYRGNEIYENLLELFLPELARIPWARTNKALSGKTIGANNTLEKDYHLYTQWSKNELQIELESKINFGWLVDTGIFDKSGLINLRDIVRNSNARVGRTNEFWLWLAGFKSLCDYAESKGKTVCFKEQHKDYFGYTGGGQEQNKLHAKILHKYLSKSELLTSTAKRIRKYKMDVKLRKLKKTSIQKNPPIFF